MTTKSKSDSVRKKLSNLAHKLNIPYRNLETVFLIERLVVRLVADKKLSLHLVFKGGFVGVAGKAHGLIQLTDQAVKVLGDPNGELLFVGFLESGILRVVV